MISTDAQLHQRRIAVQEARELAGVARHALEFVITKHEHATARHKAALEQLSAAQLTQVVASRKLSSQRTRNNERIDMLRREIQAEYDTRRAHLSDANLAWLRNDHADARYYSQEAQQCIERIQKLRESQQDIRKDTQDLKDDFEDVRWRTQEASDDVTRAAAEVRQLEQEVTRAKQHRDDANEARRRAERAFARRLNRIRTWEALFRESWPDIARAAEVPEEYVHDTKVEVDDQGYTNIFFGGKGKPNGPDHAHHVLDVNGHLYYRRRLGDPHGPQNFIPLPGPRVRTA